MWTIEVEYIADWMDSLDKESRELTIAALRILQAKGPCLKRPLVGEVLSSRFKNMKELRPGSSGSSEIRILFAFDPKRHAVMLYAGDKRGKWKAWYKKAVPVADDLYQRHLDSMEGR